MKIIGVTQGSNLKVFLQLVGLLKEHSSIDEVGAYVADAMVFKSLAKSEIGLRDGSITLLKEWDFTTSGQKQTPDWQQIRSYEQRLGDPVLWNALLADRRIFFGHHCKFRQDYRSRFTHDQMGGILQAALEHINKLFDEFKPDLILGFGTSTIGDYLFYLFAKERGIPYLQLKATKIGNRVALNDDAIELSGHIAKLLGSKKKLPEWALEEAREHLNGVRQRGIRYEGAISKERRFKFADSLTLIAKGLAIDIKRYLDPVTRNDNHSESMFYTHFYERIRNPVKNYLLERRLRNHLLSAEELKTHSDFTFYPLHFEPEVSLQVFGRPYQNQIELVRTLAANLPAGMKLLLKEHPRANGFRPWGYYQKLLDIPNVQLIETRIPTHVVVQHASLVAVVSGSTGLEAAICKRPVLTFGTPVYNALHGNMIRHITDMNSLGWEIRSLLNNYSHDEAALERYISATIVGSVPVDLYTTLLGKPGRMREGREELSEETRRQEDYEKLAKYCSLRIGDVAAPTNRA